MLNICLFLGSFRVWRAFTSLYGKHFTKGCWHPFSGIYAVLAMFFGRNSAIFSLRNVWNLPPFFPSLPKQLIYGAFCYPFFCRYQKLIWWGFCDIRNNQGRGECYQPSRRPRLITVTETLIIRISQKPNLIIFFIIHCCKEKNEKQIRKELELTFLLEIIGCRLLANEKTGYDV